MKAITAILSLCATSLSAQVVSLPSNARLEAEVLRQDDVYAAPTGVWDDGDLPVIRVTGQVARQVWVIAAAGITTRQISAPMIRQLEAAGFDIRLRCAARDCGGFDFRFATEVAPAPDMFVDLGDYLFVTATRGDTEAVTVMVSRSAQAGFVQIIHAGGTGIVAEATGRAVSVSPPDQRRVEFASQLDQIGRVVLSDLEFQIGSSDLAGGEFASLAEIAEYLTDNPTRRVALVGHTDADGSLDANIALSRRRATSVLERLVRGYGVEASQLEAQGVGYLSPLSTNLTEEGRAVNRRVEVIVTSTP